MSQRSILLYQAWEALQDFMREVKQAYESTGMSSSESSLRAVEWVDKIHKDPKQIESIHKEWDKTHLELRHYSTFKKTQKILTDNGVPPDIAEQYARTYIRDLDQIGLSTERDERVKSLQSNLNILVAEYQLREKDSNYVLPPPLEFPTLYSPKDTYEYIIDSALRGKWFPFATYVASQYGSKVRVEHFDMNPEDFAKAMSFDRVQGKILWDNIFTVVGIASLTTIIFQGLVKLYQWNYFRDNVFAVRVIDKNDPSTVWDVIKPLLHVSSLRTYETISDTTTEMLIKGSQPILDAQELNQIRKTLETGLSKAGIKTRITRLNDTPWPTFQIQT